MKQSIHVIDLDSFCKNFTNVEWAVITTIGLKGFSEYQKIEEYILGLDPSVLIHRIRSSLKTLIGIGVLRCEKVNIPTGIKSLYALTDSLGKRIYAEKTGKRAVRSQLEELCREHDNAQHGLSIEYIAEALQKNAEFKSVEYMSGRKSIELPDGKKYIPDIFCVAKSGRPIYIEYELGTTASRAFFGKCNKMAAVGNDLYFISPNIDEATALSKQVAGWINNRHTEALKNKRIFIGSARSIIEGAENIKFFEEETWCYIYKPGERGMEPVVFPVRDVAKKTDQDAKQS